MLSRALQRVFDVWNRNQSFFEAYATTLGCGCQQQCNCADREVSPFAAGLPLNAQYGAVHVAKNLSPSDIAGMWYPENAETSEYQHALHEASESPEEEEREHGDVY